MATKTRSSKTDSSEFQLRIPYSSKYLIKCKGRIRTPLFFFFLPEVSSISNVGLELTILRSRVPGSTNRASQELHGQFYTEAPFKQSGLHAGI